MSWLTYSIRVQFWVFLTPRRHVGIAYTRYLGVKQYPGAGGDDAPTHQRWAHVTAARTRFALALRAGLPLTSAHPNEARGELR